MLADDDDRRFDLIADLVRTNPNAAAEAGGRLLPDADPEARRLGADLLGQVASVHCARVPSIVPLLLGRLPSEAESSVLDALIVALGHAGDPSAQDAVLAFADHPDPTVRFAVAFSLPRLGLDEAGLEALRRLSSALDDGIRDWVTFALAESDDSDEKTVEALAARRDDLHFDTRAGGIYGLARRRDRRARGFIERELAQPSWGSLAERARDELDAPRREDDREDG